MTRRDRVLRRAPVPLPDRVPLPDPVATGLLAGYLLDRLLGDPRRGHPVAVFGSWAGQVEDRCYRPDRRSGVLATMLALAPLAALGLAARRLPPTGQTVATAATTWAALGGTSLAREAGAVHDLLASGDLPGARVRVRHLVGRRTEESSADEVARATVESVAENTSDAVVGTLVWGALLGPLGVLLHRGANTLDAMWGHRSPRYAEHGWAAARFDDVLGWLPARVTVLATAAAAGLAGAPPSSVLRTAVTDGRTHPSPNAGPVEAGFAAALRLQLGGRNDYDGEVEDRCRLGDGPPPTAGDIPRTVTLASRVGVVTLAAVLVLRLARR